MMNEANKLDKKYFGIRGRVLMLALLFLFNAMVVTGASLHYTFGKTSVIMIIGAIGTIVSIGILSTPATLLDENEETVGSDVAYSEESN